jgi:uncharacterized membrane protein
MIHTSNPPGHPADGPDDLPHPGPGGYVGLRDRALGPRAMAVLEAAPGCVLIAVIAPSFVADRPADLMALAITLAAATRLPLLPTVLIGIAAAGGLRQLLG